MMSLSTMRGLSGEDVKIIMRRSDQFGLETVQVAAMSLEKCFETVN